MNDNDKERPFIDYVREGLETNNSHPVDTFQSIMTNAGMGDMLDPDKLQQFRDYCNQQFLPNESEPPEVRISCKIIFRGGPYDGATCNELSGNAVIISDEDEFTHVYGDTDELDVDGNRVYHWLGKGVPTEVVFNDHVETVQTYQLNARFNRIQNN
jgi:hypothetical protein